MARLMHRLFSAFDAAITSAGLFKMDTVGDAYVAAGFLPRTPQRQSACGARDDGDDDCNRHAALDAAVATQGQACDRVLRAARDMIAAVAACREETGRDVHCRIGVSAGEVLAGVLGHLQPRFHIFGTGLSAAERHEKAGQIDAVHASPAFMAALALEARRWVDGAGGMVAHASAAAAAALESGSAGSSGRWDVRQSEVMDLLPIADNAAAAVGDSLASLSTNLSVRTPGGPAADGDPARGRAFLRAVASSFRISFKSSNLRSPSGGSCDVAEPTRAAPTAGLQRSFILLPQQGPGDSSETAWADPGRRFYHATASASSASLDGPPPGSPGRCPPEAAIPVSPCPTVRSPSFGAGLPCLRSQRLLLGGGSAPSADLCLDLAPNLA